MPVLTWTAAGLRENGPLLPVTVAPAGGEQEAMRAAGRAVPAPAAVTALVDTGATRTAVDRGLVGRLGLRPAGVTLVSTPSSEGGIAVLTYAVQLRLSADVVLDVASAAEARLADAGLGVLIGRDVLASAVFVYVGQSGQCTLSF